MGINQAIKHIADSNVFTEMAKKNKIDRNHWLRYVHTFRRKLLKDPLDCFNGSRELFVKFCAMHAKLTGIEANNAPIGNTDFYDDSILTISKFSNNSLSKSTGIFNKASSDADLAAYLKVVTDAVFMNARRDLADVISAYDALTKVSDLRIPHEWYPVSRLLKRKIVYHGGPTNSGKTYHALQRLMRADKERGGGLYVSRQHSNTLSRLLHFYDKRLM
jgi:hypothetical protein